MEIAFSNDVLNNVETELIIAYPYIHMSIKQLCPVKTAYRPFGIQT